MIAGLSIVGSDIDFSAEVSDSYPDVNEAKSTLDQHPHLFQNIRAVPAKTPIVKFFHAPTGHSGDLSFRNRNSIRKTAWMKYLMDVDDRVRALTIVVRYWAKLHKPEHSRHGRIMSNFAIVSLVIFYLQQLKVFSPVTDLQKNVQSVIVDKWNLGFDDTSYCTSNNASLCDLLGGFFQFYEKFDFEKTIVSTFTANPIEKSAFESIDTVPEAYALYKENVKNDDEPLNITSPVVIQDPFLHNINIAKEITLKMLEQFQSNVKFAAKAYAGPKDKFLQVILANSELLIPDEQYNKKAVCCNFKSL